MSAPNTSTQGRAGEIPSIDAPLTVILDLRYPQAYLALHPAARLAKRLGIAIDWLPFSVSPLKPPTPPSDEGDRGLLHRRHRAEAIAAEIEIYAEAQDLVLHEYYRDGEAGAFELAWLWIRSHHAQRLEGFLFEGFRAYWAVELDPASLSQATALVDAQGADGPAFRSWAGGDGPGVAQALESRLRDRGVFGVPTYWVEDEVFLGRQHGPMIAWILEGRRGAVPI